MNSHTLAKRLSDSFFGNVGKVFPVAPVDHRLRELVGKTEPVASSKRTHFWQLDLLRAREAKRVSSSYAGCALRSSST